MHFFFVECLSSPQIQCYVQKIVSKTSKALFSKVCFFEAQLSMFTTPRIMNKMLSFLPHLSGILSNITTYAHLDFFNCTILNQVIAFLKIISQVSALNK